MPRARSATARNPNRTDLAAPVTAPTGQPYGVRAQQIAAQGAIPMGPQPIASPGPGPGGPPPPIDMAAMQAGMAQHAAIHGPPQPLNRPTERPNEPVTHGLPVGPGGGPVDGRCGRYCECKEVRRKLTGTLPARARRAVESLIEAARSRHQNRTFSVFWTAQGGLSVLCMTARQR